jgi:pyruvate carboxylase
MFKKVLVANRGEIAVRAFRAAYELGIASAALYTPDDRGSVHRVKADEAYEVGEAGHPVRAYLDIDLVVDLALRIGADAIYPGYGFMSENPELARACARAGLVFVGPPAQVLAAAGNKVRAREAAKRAGVPVLRASEILGDPADAAAAAEGMSFPLFVKAAEGGGGRGMRLVAARDDLEESARSAMREAEGAFGDSSVYLEEALVRPRHIEVQILADAEGNVIHLFERDCSVQRRHQKVIELAPAPNLDRTLRDRLCEDAVRFAREVGYVNAGTVEFLVDPERGEHVFIEMNPRIQVEHTVTEETTDVDLVRSQLLIAGGATLADLGLHQVTLRQRGVALQCRITTEDPSADFRPDNGRISAYRAPGGAGIRLDEGTAYVGAEISPYYDPLLLKVTARGEDLRMAIARARRAVDEVRVRGVSTNQAFLRAILDDPDFRAGRTYTTFVDDRPGLTAVGGGGDRASRLLRRLAEVTVNSPFGPPPHVSEPATKLPPLPAGDPPPGSRERLQELGAAGFARWLRDEDALGVTDTTMRDAHQSLLATRMRTFDMAVVAPHIARLLPQMLSLEVWGGATYDVALRFLSEDPWERLALLRERIPNLCLQMLLRGRNLLGYEHYSERAVRAFVAEATATGIDIFRIFDALNNVDPMRAAIDATLEAGAVAEAAVCYTGDLSDPTERMYTLDYYLRVAEGLVDAGAHILAIKDMAGLLRAPAARTLVTRLRAEFDLPVHLHTHDTAGGQLATYLAAIEAGVDAIDGAAAPMAGRTSQPSLSAIVSATDFTDRATGLSLPAVLDLEPYWEAVRSSYAPFETRMRAPTGRVYRHQIPGGQLTNLRQQSIALGLGERFEDIETAYVSANELLGNIIKVTPTSKVVGDLALFAVSGGIDWNDLREHPERFDLPDSVLGFLRGDLGEPAGGLPHPFAERALREAGGNGSGPATHPHEEEPELPDPGPERRAALSELMFPGPFRDEREARKQYGDVSVVPTLPFFYGLREDVEHAIDLEPGVRLVVGLEAIGEPDARGMRTVLTRLNGQLRPIDVRDESIQVTSVTVERADPKDPDHVAAPLAGNVTVSVKEGAEVAEGDPVAVLEAMKMESTITAPHAGRVARIAAPNGGRLEQGDLILVLTATRDA